MVMMFVMLEVIQFIVQDTMFAIIATPVLVEQPELVKRQCSEGNTFYLYLQYFWRTVEAKIESRSFWSKQIEQTEEHVKQFSGRLLKHWDVYIGCLQPYSVVALFAKFQCIKMSISLCIEGFS